MGSRKAMMAGQVTALISSMFFGWAFTQLVIKPWWARAGFFGYYLLFGGIVMALVTAYLWAHSYRLAKTEWADETKDFNDELEGIKERVGEMVEHWEDVEDLVGYVDLHINTRFVTGQLTTEQKELYADLVDESARRLDPDEPRLIERWWRE